MPIPEVYMDRPRVSVSGLAAIVLVSAIGVAALRGESSLWAGSLLLLDLAIFAFAVLAVIYREGARRAWWAGFALFGWGYLAIAFGPWAAEAVAPRLATSMIMDSMYAKFGPPIPSRRHEGALRTAAQLVTSARRLDSAARIVDELFETRALMTPEEREKLYALRDLLDPEKQVILVDEQGGPRRDHRPIRASREDFRQAGHCLFALLAACLGGCLARVLHGGSGMRQDGRELPPRVG